MPNAAVTSLQYFNSGGMKRLRAATYGRGVWEWNLITTPDFQVSIGNNPQTVFAGSSATYNGTIIARNGYSSSVNLSCTDGSTPPPQTCSVVPLSVVLTSVGTAFTVSASGPAGAYSFNLHAVGTDASAITHDFALTLHITDFTLSTPSPASVTVTPGAVGSAVSLTVSAIDQFSSSVTLSCAGLPTGAACVFTPSNVVNPINRSPVSVSLNISTLPSTVPSTSQITISAATPGATTKTQNLALIVSATPDYTLSISNSPQTVQTNTTAVFNGTLTAINGYSSAVALSCEGQAPPNCAVTPASGTPIASGAAFTVNASSGIAQSYSFTINAVGSDSAATVHSASISLTALPAATFDFTMGVNPQSASVPVGQATTYALAVNPTTGSFPWNMTFSCSNLPALTICTFSPTQVGAGSGNSTVALTVATTAPGHAISAGTFALILLPMVGLLCSGAVPRRLRVLCVHMLAVALVTGACISCGGGLQGNGTAGGGSGNPGTPKGTYNIMVTATCGSVTHSLQASLTVK
jgi:hypothetical protein